MSDFEDRLGRALGEGAEDAPVVVGIADAARLRARRRRTRRVGLGAGAAVVATALPIALVSAYSGDGGGTATPATDTVVGQRVTCGGGTGWEVRTMDGGLPGVLDDAEVREAFTDVLAEAPMDAPTAIREQGAQEAPYIVLAGDDDDAFTIGIGPWSIEGPGRSAMSADLERQPDGSLRLTSWGDCRLESALPPGRSLVEVTAPDDGVDPTTTTPVVLVSEVQCAGGRDPESFLGEPVIVVDDERVLVTMTSDPVVGGADCPGNPFVPLTLTLDEPIGDRAMLDAGTFPPTPIEVAEPIADGAGEWQTVTYEGDPVDESGDNRVLIDLPVGWERLDTSGCDFSPVRFGPPEKSTSCSTSSSLSLVPDGTFDSIAKPGLDGPDDAAGEVRVGSLLAYVDAPDHETARRILASARLPGESAPSATWTTDSLGGLYVEVPDDGLVSFSLAQVYTQKPGRTLDAKELRSGEWLAVVAAGQGSEWWITAPTQALADVVASTVRPAG